MPGSCAIGEQGCTPEGTWGVCSAPVPALADTCETGNDANCNGMLNDDCECVNGDTRTCAEGGLFGSCAAGTQSCAAGSWGPCDITPAASDTCAPENDANCNGEQNEDCPCETGDTRACSAGGLFGPCALGTQSCDSAGFWGACSILPAPFDGCSAGDDANCDGQPNSPLAATCQCVQGDRRCAAGTPSTAYQLCSAGGTWGAAQDCQYVCAGAGTCTGSCTPGDKQCSPSGLPQSCSNAGAWQDQPACGSGMLCQSGDCQSCTGDTYLSGGACIPFTDCQPGQRVQTAGSPTSDRVCAPCETGFTTAMNAASCTPWTSCDAGLGLVMAQAGTALTDQTCKAFPSCTNLSNDCGPNNDESCCASILLAGGAYNRWNEGASPATISPFRLDKYEITVGRFRKFKAAWDAGWTPPNGNFGKHTHLNDGNGLVKTGDTGYEDGWNGFWQGQVLLADELLACDSTRSTWTVSPGSNELRPMNCINWYATYAFCMWDGGFLPSDAEWAFAAMGGGDANGQRMYPWSVPSSSTTIDATHASYNCTGDGSASTSCTSLDLLGVGSRSLGNARWGHADMAGNVDEWVLDRALDPRGDTCNDCTYQPGAAGSSDVTIRGGSFEGAAGFLYNTYSLSQHPAEADYQTGGRCARVP